jgi:hypothetical protein
MKDATKSKRKSHVFTKKILSFLPRSIARMTKICLTTQSTRPQATYCRASAVAPQPAGAVLRLAASHCLRHVISGIMRSNHLEREVVHRTRNTMQKLWQWKGRLLRISALPSMSRYSCPSSTALMDKDRLCASSLSECGCVPLKKSGGARRWRDSEPARQR